MAKRFTQSDIQNLSDRTIFFDANIVIYLFGTMGTGPKCYSSIFKKLFGKNRLAINTTVLSEFINRALRFEYNKKLVKDDKSSEDLPFKSFRNSPEGQLAQTEIFDIVKDKVLKYFQVIDKQLTGDDIKNMLTIDTLDFNDKIILDVCKTHNMVLLTNDTDFANADIDILSANQKILKK